MRDKLIGSLIYGEHKIPKKSRTWQEALKVSDYVYVIADGVVLGKGTPEEIKSSKDPYLHQFLNALPDGPVRFHFPGPPLEEDLRLTPTEEAP